MSATDHPDDETRDRWQPEAFMRIAGLQPDARHLCANLVYIARLDRSEDERAALEDEWGSRIDGQAAIRKLAREWEDHELAGDDRRKGAVSRSMVLSAPRGSDPQKVLEAAREWAHKEFSDRSWVMALHTDTANPHAHITYAIRGADLARWNPRRGDLYRQRKAWARELTARGIPVVATTVPDRILARQRRVSVKVER